MRVVTGTRLGPYQIVALLGAGGMGEVWRARDTRLDRSVAVKILPAAFSADPHLKARLQHEAKAISQLNHPHICSLYDVGHDDGTDFLVMELIEGQTLADRLARGPLPLADIIRYGEEIAEALDNAHRSGVVHRDLKPQNIMLTKSGTKLLDFGLAGSEGAGVVVGSTTLQKPLTAEGNIVGTIHYMSPEQLAGQEVDHRSDIFALGAVLYEMATGKRAFHSNSSLQPHALDQLVRACTAKDPDARVQSAHDVALQLRWIGESPATSARKAEHRWLPWIVAAALALMLAATAIYHVRTGRVAQPVRFTIPAPPGTAINGVPAISPDGHQIVFRTVAVDGSSMLWIRSIDSVETRPLKGTEGATFEFWSPDGKNLGFMARGKLWRLALTDGSVRTIYEPVEDPPGGATWNSHDVIVFSPRVEGTLFRVSASGGAAVLVATTERHEFAYWPWFLPDGDHFIYIGEGKGPNGVYVASLTSGQTKLIAKSGTRPAFAAGNLFFMNGSSLYAQKFDTDKLEVRGDLVKIDDDVQHFSPGRASFAVSETGTIVYRKSGAPIVAQLTFVNRGGQKLSTIGDAAPIGEFRLSPDERRIVYMREDNRPSIWMLDTSRGTSTQIVFEWAGWPMFMPDSRSIVYAASVNGGPPNLCLRRADGSVERLTSSDQQNYPTSVTPDGHYVVYDFSSPQTGFDLYAISTSVPRKPFAVVSSPFREVEGTVSPDGRWLAFTSNASGTNQIYGIAFPSGGGRVQISNAGGVRPCWSRDGRELFYIDPAARRLMAAKMDVAEGELRPSVPASLFPLQLGSYDVTRDGRFLITEDRVNPDAPGLTVVLSH